MCLWLMDMNVEALRGTHWHGRQCTAFQMFWKIWVSPCSPPGHPWASDDWLVPPKVSLVVAWKKT